MNAHPEQGTKCDEHLANAKGIIQEVMEMLPMSNAKTKAKGPTEGTKMIEKLEQAIQRIDLAN